MLIRKENDKSKAICYSCEKVVKGTYKVRDVDFNFNDQSSTVKDILVLVCDNCNKTVATPAQSTPKIKEAYDKIRSNN